jgi:hypothetical protein
MTERELEILRFNKIDVSAEESGDKPFHYYIHEIVPGLELISNSDDEVIDGKWYVEFFNTKIPVRFHDMGKVLGLINLLTKAIVNEKEQ